MTHAKKQTHYFQLRTSKRRLAFSQVGSANSSRVLICLPGLLETRSTFDPLLRACENLQGLRVISMDHCGRGDSDQLAGDKGYCMSVYLEDTLEFLRQEVIGIHNVAPQIELVGTSMGGILAMYLASDKNNHISGLFLNDIGLSLNWMSIYGLYDGMKKAGRLPEPVDLAAELNVSVGAVMAVSSPSHFDLPYRKDWKGMQFGHLLNNFNGLVRLVHGSESGVCLSEQVKSLKREFTNAKVLEVTGAAHPVPFNDEVNQFIVHELKLPDEAVTVELTEAPTAHVSEPVTQQQRPSLLGWIKQRLQGAIKK